MRKIHTEASGLKSPITPFLSTAANLARNPLGIIALFIVLVYGIAALVFGFTASNIDEGERLPIVWFLVLFPVLVLAAFYRLVTHHHMKLYAPNDFHDDEAFFRGMTPQEQVAKLDAEIRETEQEGPAEEAIPATPSRTFGGPPANAGASLEADLKLHASEARRKYLIAEDLAFRELERERRGQVQRRVAVNGQTGLLLDGVLYDANGRYGIEIKFARSAATAAMVAGRAINQVASLWEVSQPQLTGMLLVVVVGGAIDSSNIAQRMARALAAHPTIELVIYSLDELTERYGL